MEYYELFKEVRAERQTAGSNFQPLNIALNKGKALNEGDIRQGYERFKAEKNARELAGIAVKHGLESAALQDFVVHTMWRMIFDGEELDDLLPPLGTWLESPYAERIGPDGRLDSATA
jgi:hypothetical protein